MYNVVLEVGGPLAIWTRPDTGGSPTSYPAPTWSACKGILESIAFFADGSAWFSPAKVEICRLVGDDGGVRFHKYATNYGGPLRKDQLISKGANMQLFATALADVCYRIHAEIKGDPPRNGRNPRHHLQDLFNRRLKRGEVYQTPALGWKEFTCTYWGPFRDSYEVDTTIDLTIPSMSVSPWDRQTRRYGARFVQNVRIERGVLLFAE